MRQKLSLAEFGMKADSEGGLFDAVVLYGLDETDIERSEDPALYDDIAEFVKLARALEPLMDDVREQLEVYIDEHLEEE